MKMTSPAFENAKVIPKKYTCQGEDINPPLIIEGIPPNAKSLVLIVDDPDAPMGTWLHWLVYDMPVISDIKEDSIPGKEGLTSARNLDYHGPCPPSGTHRYYFRIYALDKTLGLKEGASRRDVERAMAPHVLDKAEFMGTYRKE